MLKKHVIENSFLETKKFKKFSMILHHQQFLSIVYSQ